MVFPVVISLSPSPVVWTRQSRAGPTPFGNGEDPRRGRGRRVLGGRLTAGCLAAHLVPLEAAAMKLDRHVDLLRVARAYDTPVRDVIQRVAVCACAAVVLVIAAPASGVSQRTISVTLSGGGTALWKLESSRETDRLV